MFGAPRDLNSGDGSAVGDVRAVLRDDLVIPAELPSASRVPWSTSAADRFRRATSSISGLASTPATVCPGQRRGGRKKWRPVPHAASRATSTGSPSRMLFSRRPASSARAAVGDQRVLVGDLVVFHGRNLSVVGESAGEQGLPPISSHSSPRTGARSPSATRRAQTAPRAGPALPPGRPHADDPGPRAVSPLRFVRGEGAVAHRRGRPRVRRPARRLHRRAVRARRTARARRGRPACGSSRAWAASIGARPSRRG